MTDVRRSDRGVVLPRCFVHGDLAVLGCHVTELTDHQLDSLLETVDDDDLRKSLIVEKARRGRVPRKLLLKLKWNKQTVKSALEPFVEISKSVVRSRRTRYSEAGGRKIGLPKNHPDKLWIDSYTAIKVGKLNAVFACHVARVGDEPIFELIVKPGTKKTYSHLECDLALRDWEEIALQARSDVAQ